MLPPPRAKQLLALITHERWSSFEEELRVKLELAERRLATQSDTVEIFRLQGRIAALEELLKFKVNTIRDAQLDG